MIKENELQKLILGLLAQILSELGERCREMMDRVDLQPGESKEPRTIEDFLSILERDIESILKKER
jgi:hypothetical protein